jgi:hypothetical protein
MKHTYKLGKDIVREVDFGQLGLPENVSPVALHCFTVGLGNVLRDTHASITEAEAGDKFKELSAQAVDEKLGELIAGIVRASGGGRESNPVTREANAIALQLTNAQYRKNGKKLADHAKEIRADAAKLALNPKVIALAEKRVAEAKELDVEITG